MIRKIHNVTAALLLSLTSFAQETKTSPFHIGILYPISSNGIHAADYINSCSIHAIAGLSGGERGFCASGFANVIAGSASGFVAGGFANIIKEEAKGAQVAGFMNCTGSSAEGLQAAGFMNLASNGSAAQLAGFTNVVAGNMEGFQGAGCMNIAANADVQVAGFINVANNVHTQIAGFINVAKKVKGTQIGVINIAEENKNPIGIVNIIKNGEKNIGITVDESLTTMTTFRSGGRNLYGIIGAGYNMKNAQLLWAVETGLGVHAPISKNFRLNFEISASSLTDFTEDAYFKSSFRAFPSLMITDRWEVFAGPTFNFIEYSIYNEGLDGSYFWSDTNWGSFYGFSFGAIGGVQLHL